MKTEFEKMRNEEFYDFCEGVKAVWQAGFKP